MTMTNGFAEPADRPGRTHRVPDPLQMSEAEKRAAEWEARHDVAARGHRAGPEVLQHYFAHDRLVHGEPPHPTGPHAVPRPREAARAEDQAGTVASRRQGRGLFRRLIGRRP